ncbi:MAG: ATP-binding protein [Actinomycetota bacterium]|nr:ATP-binding protein [Actinomycetota bacterium]
MARETRPSLQDHLRRRQEDDFVGRMAQIGDYQQNLGTPPGNKRHRFIFNVYGDAGVGKTSLTERLRQIAVDHGYLAACVDDQRSDDVISAMSVIADEFSQNRARLGEFEKRLAAYRKHRHTLESDSQAPEGVAALVTRTAVAIGISAARSAPVAGGVLAQVDAAAVGDQVNQARAYLARKFKDHGDVRLLLAPESELTSAFVTGLNRIGADRPIALFFDSYERTGLFLDRWLVGLYSAQYGDLPEKLITTVSGQNQLDQNLWHKYRPIIADMPLKPFSEAEARQFLVSKDIRDERMIKVILTLSGCLPMWLATLAEARPADATEIGDPAGDAVERFLKWEEDPERKAIALAAALPRMINQDVLAVVTPPGKAHEMFGWLCGLPFVSPRARSWVYHEVVRAAMLRLQRAQAPSQWRSHHLALAQANERWAQDSAGWPSEAWTNPKWADYIREQMYHLLCADSVSNLAQALDFAQKAAEHSGARGRQWAEMIADAGRDTDDPELSQWARHLGDSIHDSELARYFPDTIDDPPLDEEIPGTTELTEGPQEPGIVILGPPYSGKTTFLAAFSIALNRKETGWNVVGGDEASEQALIGLTTGLTRQRKFPAATAGIENYRWLLNGQIPRARRSLFRSQGHHDPVQICLDLADVSGELAEPDLLGYSARRDLIELLARSRGIIYAFDPTREFEEGDAFDSTFSPLVQLARLEAGTSGLPGGRLPHYVAVCVTKFDETRVFKTAKQLNALTVASDDPLGFPRVADKDAREFFRRLCHLSSSGNAEMVLNVLEQYFAPERVRYFVTSAIGFYTDPDTGRFNSEDPQNYVPDDQGPNLLLIRGPVHPVNVAEPLLWLARQVGSAPGTGARSRRSGSPGFRKG